MSYKIYVDGQSGTTGLQIHERLSQYSDLELLTIDPDKRRDPQERKRLLNEADLVFLCLPDDAARESVVLIDNPNTRVIDASTAHRVTDGWVYGLPEYDQAQRDHIRTSKRVAVTGCHAAASILSLKPLREAGVITGDYPVTLHSITGYSGGGKNMIEQYEHSDDGFLKSPRHYALGLQHKHLPEICRYADLQTNPVFLPIVSSFYQGLAVTLPLHKALCNGQYSVADIREVYRQYYDQQMFVRVLGHDDSVGVEPGFFDVQACNGTNRADIAVLGNDDQIIVITRLDNLGKGASGAAIQCMNIMLGFEEDRSLKR
ncbi:N-acetyl-gamma-glutamyl-phosphate reductase [Gynuella sp.]|uniref:N-acetyl-gamma-glutamyl-phosphate reductase n=1 Tax=Gynuella sp. TaxID=2969146 RepID=UPI003D119F6E